MAHTDSGCLRLVAPPPCTYTGTVAVMCSGDLPRGLMSVTLRVTAQHTGCGADAGGVVAERTAVIASVCCGTGSLFAKPNGGKCFNDARCSAGSTAFVTKGPASSGAMMADVSSSPACGIAAATSVGSITVTCVNDRTAVFNVTNAKVSQLTTSFWTSCYAPGTSGRSACNGWRTVPKPGGPVSALAPAVTYGADTAHTSWRVALAPGGCKCSALYWSVAQAGTYGSC